MMMIFTVAPSGNNLMAICLTDFLGLATINMYYYYYYYYVSDEEELVHDMRKAMDLNSWCDCGECAKMATEKECLCCQELNSAQLHELGGKCFSFLTSPQINVVTSTLFIFYY